MNPAWAVMHWFAALALPVLFVGVVNRTKALWAGRRGPPLAQLAFDLRRLFRKRPVYSQTATAVFPVSPWIMLGTTLATAAFIPILGYRAPASLPYDFVLVAYLWGLGRVAMILGAMDTGSSFEGMGASREATYAAMIEPALFAVFGTLVIATGGTSLVRLLDAGHGLQELFITSASAAALAIVLQVEAARLPIDDPNTHLELTMIHEVMVLDHSGPELAAVQYGAALKMTLCASALATLVNPFRPTSPNAAAAINLGLILGVAVAVGLVESLIARLRLRVVPQYISAAVFAALIALLTAAYRAGGEG